MNNRIITIGLRFTHNDREGVVLQMCNKLPNHYNSEDIGGPFYGVYYEENYVWYSEQELTNIIRLVE